ncbi:hypothetical protein VDIAB_270392 [Vibrio diabolicus]|nr:hypothetical protein VDIAB_270392 [Vibrio diabolicus]
MSGLFFVPVLLPSISHYLMRCVSHLFLKRFFYSAVTLWADFYKLRMLYVNRGLFCFGNMPRSSSDG